MTGFYYPQYVTISVCVCVYLCTATEAARVQEGEEVEAEGSGQQAGEVCGLQREPSAHTEVQEQELLGGAAQHTVLQHHPPLPVRPPVKLTQKDTILPHALMKS